MQVNWARVARALVATVILTMSVFTAGPASAGLATPLPAAEVTPAAAPGPYRITSRQFTPDQCLDVDGNTVIWFNCNERDRGQHWIIWNGGWTKNVATGTCLRGKDHVIGGVSYNVQLVSCNANDRNQYWRHWSPEWYKNLRSNACLDAWRDPTTGWHMITTSPCKTVNSMFWIVDLWP